MNKITLTLALLTGLCLKTFAQVGFNNPNPAPSSIVDLTANDKGLLIPRMTTAQRNAISNPANGLLVFDITLDAFCEYDTIVNPDKWQMISPWKASPNGNGNIITNTTGNVGVEVVNPQHKVDVKGNIRCTDTLIATTGRFTGDIIANNFSGNGSVPSGAIIMWSGPTPPTGWKVCDGTSGTPDLRGRFIVGSGANGNPAAGDINPNYTLGNIGGENVHSLTKSEIPKHKHTISNTPSDNGQVTVGATSVDDRYAALGADPSLKIGAGASFTNLTNQPAHTHTITGNTGDGTTDGMNAQAHENRPPYYVLMYIMKQ